MPTKVSIPASTVALLAATLRTLESKVAAETNREVKVLPLWLPNGEYITELKDLAAVLCIDERTAAFAVLDSCNPSPGLLAEAKRRVKTPAGALWYGQPIGSEIRRDKHSWGGRIIDAALAGGMTLSLLSGAEPKTGYAVAERGNNMEIPAEVFFDKRQGMAELRKWANAHEAQFDDPAAHLGIWYDKEHEEVCLDISYVLDDHDEAVALGKHNNQQAIWDIANTTEINTGGTGDREGKDLVRTPAGQERYGQPIGSVITRDHTWRNRIMSAILAGGVALTFLGGAALGEDGGGVTFEPHIKEATISDVEFFNRGRGLSAMRDYVTEHADIFNDNPAAHLSVWHDEDRHEVVMSIPFVIADPDEALLDHNHIWLSHTPEETDLGERISQTKGHDDGQGLYHKAAEAGQRDDIRGDGRLVGDGLGRDARGFGEAGNAVKSGIIRHRGARSRADQRAVTDG